MFRGRFEHTIDDKGRLAIPSKYREIIIGNQDAANLVVTHFDKCLAAYTLQTWEKLEEKIASMPHFDPVVIAFQRYFISGACECQLDKSGRILIPQNLRESAGIQNHCIIAGGLHKFEIWSDERWTKEFSCLSDQFFNINKSLSEIGIQL